MDKKKVKTAPSPTAAQEFSGRIKGITAGAQFRFDVAAKKSGCRSYSIAAGDAAMAALVTASYLTGTKVFVTGVANGEAIHVASEIRIGAKPKPHKVKAYPKKLKAPAEPVPAAASAPA